MEIYRNLSIDTVVIEISIDRAIVNTEMFVVGNVMSAVGWVVGYCFF